MSPARTGSERRGAGLLEAQGALDLLESSPALTDATVSLVTRDEVGFKDLLLPLHAAYRKEVYAGLLAGLERIPAQDQETGDAAVRGRLLRLLGDEKGAGQAFDEALRTDPGCALAFAARGEARILRDPEAAAADLERAVSLEPASGAYLAWLGYARLCLGDEAGALAALDKALGRGTGGAAPFFLRGLLRARRGEFESAERDLTAALAVRPGATGLYALRAESRWRLARQGEAVEDGHAAATLDPEALDGFLRILYLSQGAHRPFPGDFRRLEAAGLASAFLRRDRGAAWAYALRGEMMSDDQSSSARMKGCGDLMRAVELEPGRAWMRALLSRSMASDGSDARWHALCLASLDRAIAEEPGSGWMRAWRSQLRVRAGRREEGLRELDEAIALDPDYRAARGFRGKLRLDLGDLEGAESDLTAHLEVNRRPWIAHERARAAWSLGRFLESLDDLSYCVAAAPRYAFAYAGWRSWLEDDAPGSWSELRRRRCGDAAVSSERPSSRHLRLGSEELEAALGGASLEGLGPLWVGRALLNEGSPEAALPCFDSALRGGRHPALAWAWRGEALCRLGRHGLAIESLDRALEESPGFLDAGLWRGRAKLLSGRREEGLLDLVLACRSARGQEALACRAARRLLPGRACRGGDRGAVGALLAELALLDADDKRAARGLEGEAREAFRRLSAASRSAETACRSLDLRDPARAALTAESLWSKVRRLRLAASAKAALHLARRHRSLGQASDSRRLLAWAAELARELEILTVVGEIS